MRGVCDDDERWLRRIMAAARDIVRCGGVCAYGKQYNDVTRGVLAVQQRRCVWQLYIYTSCLLTYAVPAVLYNSYYITGVLFLAFVTDRFLYYIYCL